MSTDAAKTILLVENDPDIREVVYDVLERRGFRTLTAEHGLDALTVLHASRVKPCLILLDLTMPVMNGWEFMAAQAGDPAIRDIPVVVMSAVANLEQQASNQSWAGVLMKPVTLETLLQTVSQFCPPRSS